MKTETKVAAITLAGVAVTLVGAVFAAGSAMAAATTSSTSPSGSNCNPGMQPDPIYGPCSAPHLYQDPAASAAASGTALHFRHP